MRYWFDTEFMEDGRIVAPLSIGIVSEDGREYYCEFDTNRGMANEWVRKNVFPFLTGPIKRSREIREDILSFVTGEPEFWAYYAAYDWVIMCQLFGTMMRLPESWPKYCLDIKQVMHMKGIRSVQRPEGGDHNALADARWNRRIWKEIIAA